MSFPKYEVYKDSGVAQLGSIPNHWTVSRLGFETWIRARLGWKGLKAEEYVDEGYIFLSTPNIKSRDIDFENVNYINQIRFDESPEIKLREGDVLLAKDGSTLGISNFVRILPCPTTVNSSIAVITPNCRLDGLYLKYLFDSTFLQNTIQSVKGGMGVPHLFQSDLNKFYIPLPTIDEQTQIARFLDHETARIDALIAEQERLIELLKEKRQAVISHAVTKGLDPTVPMKDSGVEWLGEVPAHWGVVPLRYLVHEKVAGPYGASLTKAMYTNSGYRVYGQQQVIADDFEIGDYYISEEKFQEMKRYEVFSDDVLISVMGTVGRVAVVPKIFEPGIINPRLVRYKFNSTKVIPEYIKNLLSSLLYQNRLREASQGSTMEGLNMAIISDIKILIPPQNSQSLIVSFIKKKQSDLDALIDEAKLAVNLLQERRSALISAAVTGKIDVRGWQPPESDHPAATLEAAYG